MEACAHIPEKSGMEVVGTAVCPNACAAATDRTDTSKTIFRIRANALLPLVAGWCFNATPFAFGVKRAQSPCLTTNLTAPRNPLQRQRSRSAHGPLAPARASLSVYFCNLK